MGNATSGWSRPAGFRQIFGIDLRTLALFRILLGFYLLADICLRLRDLTAHYSDLGVMPRAVQMDYLSLGSYSLHLANGSSFYQGFLFAVAAAAALMMIIGWKTRFAVIASWILLISVQNRNTFILSGEDNLAVLLTFWAMFLPLGARYSVDAALDPASDKVNNRYFSTATLALLVQGMSMYLFSALLKSDARWMPDGTAVYYALNLDYMVTPFGLWFRQFEPLLQALTYYVYWLELIGPILMFSPFFHRSLRIVLMCAFITMHLGFMMCLEIGLFPVISIIMNLTFLPGWVWDGLAKWAARRRMQALAIWYDRDCTFCLKACRVLRIFLFLGDAPIRPAQDDPTAGPLLEKNNSWVVTSDQGSFLKWNAMRQLVRGSPVLRPLAFATGVRPVVWLGERSYDRIAANRARLARISERLLPWRTIPRRAGWMTNGLAGVFLIFITVQNVATLPAVNWTLPDRFVIVRQALGLFQYWTMFAPHPELTSPWPVIEGKLTDGTVVDVYRQLEGDADTSRPDVVSSVYRNYRWRKFLSNLEDQSYNPVDQFLALNYARYLCRTWKAAHPDTAQLATFSIVFNVEFTPPPDVPRVVEQRDVWLHDCLG
ncbi:HTTM domain-containing protein [Hoeflea poritis]|uniref:HTTM domain-containing protein n=1 Tax=Hoeflea poritis TaxID=2993659 RepID=A0ABT4VRN2_9HYPH|nr:HTTM domain-containing protein [Hoeflea poritis]MDA4847349.1 HTTM domain-containing protein [Hoeflea poritis]